MELLHDFGKATTDYTNDVGKNIPSDSVPILSERPSTISSIKENLSAPVEQSKVPINRESMSDHKEQTDEICYNLPETESENKKKLLKLIKRETQDTSGIKIEQGLDVKLDPATVQLATADWVPKLESDNITPKHEDVGLSVHTPSDDAIKPKSEEEDVDSSLDFTLIDAGLLKSLMECNKPRTKPHSTSKKHKRSSKIKKS